MNVLVVGVFTGGEDVGVNPKISNMLQGYHVAKYDAVWISDSGCLGVCMICPVHTYMHTHVHTAALSHTDVSSPTM